MSELLPRHPTSTLCSKASTATPTPAAPAWLPRHALTLSPPTAARLIGREQELELIASALDSGVRLLTLQGFAGVGKTRLALAAAEHWTEAHAPAAVWFIDATMASDLRDLCDSIAHALDVPLSKAADTQQALETLTIALEAKGRGLLVIDSAERVIDATRELAQWWLTRTDNLHLLVTSRRLLGARAETTLTLKPLSLPSTSDTSWEAIARSDAVQLLAERADAVGSRTQLIENPSITAQIVRRLDGLPLALELAAAQLRVLGPEDLLRRLERRFELLESSNQEAPARQRTLKAAIDWSWDQLDPWEREALAQLSVLHGDFGVDLAEAIINPSAAEAPAALSILAALQSKSLVQIDPDSESSAHARLRLLESVREYASANLRAQGDEEATWRRLSHFLLREAERAAERVSTRGDIEALHWLARERRHLVALHQRAAGAANNALGSQSPQPAPQLENATAAVRAAVYLDPLLAVRGPADLRLELLSTACALVDTLTEQPGLGARTHLARVAVEHDLCSPDNAIEHEHSALAYARQAQDPKLLARALAELARASCRTRRREQAVNRADEALTLARQHDDLLGQAEALTTRGIALWELDEWDRATSDSLAALQLARELDHPSLEGRALGNLAGLAIDFGDRKDYIELSELALACFTRCGDRQREAIATVNLAAYYHDEGELLRAEEYLLLAREILQEVGDRDVSVNVEGSLGCLEQELRGIEHGHGRLQQAARDLGGTAFWLAETFVLARLGASLAARGRLHQAGDAFCRARSARLEHDDRRIDDALALLEAHLDLAEARALDAGGDSRAADAERGRVSRLLQTVDERWQGLSGAEARALGGMRFEGSRELRAAMKLLRVALAEPVSMRRSYRAPPPNALVIGDDATWFRPPGREQVSLGKRKALRRILEALVYQRREHPGRATLPLSLVEQGWPGERILQSAANNRIHVAIAGLRRLGLDTVLIKNHEGYLLDPHVPLAEGYRLAMRIEAVEPPN